MAGEAACVVIFLFNFLLVPLPPPPSGGRFRRSVLQLSLDTLVALLLQQVKDERLCLLERRPLVQLVGVHVRVSLPLHARVFLIQNVRLPRPTRVRHLVARDVDVFVDEGLHRAAVGRAPHVGVDAEHLPRVFDVFEVVGGVDCVGAVNAGCPVLVVVTCLDGKLAGVRCDGSDLLQLVLVDADRTVVRVSEKRDVHVVAKMVVHHREVAFARLVPRHHVPRELASVLRPRHLLVRAVVVHPVAQREGELEHEDQEQHERGQHPVRLRVRRHGAGRRRAQHTVGHRVVRFVLEQLVHRVLVRRHLREETEPEVPAEGARALLDGRQTSPRERVGLHLRAPPQTLADPVAHGVRLAQDHHRPEHHPREAADLEHHHVRDVEERKDDQGRDAQRVVAQVERADAVEDEPAPRQEEDTDLLQQPRRIFHALHAGPHHVPADPLVVQLRDEAVEEHKQHKPAEEEVVQVRDRFHQGRALFRERRRCGRLDLLLLVARRRRRRDSGRRRLRAEGAGPQPLAELDG
eukprot:Rhum_TRINITY_DN14152_c1_g1::Rhum_TRINITY_DN14152_c1_g1_i1::g.70283::m.70283